MDLCNKHDTDASQITVLVGSTDVDKLLVHALT